MHSAASWLLYVLFAGILASMYLSIRRQWAPPGATAGLGTISTIACFMLIALAQGDNAVQAIVIGVLVGAAFSAATLAIAWYFHTTEMKARVGGQPVAPAAPPSESQATPSDDEF